MKYKSELIHGILEQRGHEKSSLHYQSECVESWVEEAKGGYPKLCDYESEWLNYINENPIGEFPYETVTTNNTATVNSVVPLAYESAILKGSTKYRDIDTGDILDTFDETRNLELVSVKMPVLTTSNEDGTKSNILTVNEDVTLRSNGSMYDELDLLTGQLTQKLKIHTVDGNSPFTYGGANSELCQTLIAISLDDSLKNSPMLLACDKLPYKTHNYNLANGLGIGLGSDGRVFMVIPVASYSDIKPWLTDNPITFLYPTEVQSIKTVDLTVVNQDGEPLSKIKPIEGTMHIEVSGTPINPTAVLEVPVEAITQNLNSFIEEE